MDVAALTPADVDRLRAKIDAGDRAGFYLLYHDLTGSNEALTQAEVSSFSGELGRMAKQANSAVQAYLWAIGRGDQYPGTIENFSRIIAKDLYNRVAEDVANGRTGVFTDQQIFDRAKEQWRRHGIGDCFPGNLLRFGFPGVCSLVGGIAAGQDAEAIGLPAGPAIPPGGQQLTTPDGQATYIIDGSGTVVPGSVQRTQAAPRPFQFDATRPDDHSQINAPDRAGQAASVAPNDGGSVPYQWPGITAGGMPPWIPALAPPPPSAPGGPFDWLQSDLLGKVGGLAPGGAFGPPQPNVSGALSAPLPQTRITPQPFPALPPSPFSVPVPPALQPLVPHFFPQGFDTNNTRAWPSARTSDDAGTQRNPVGSAGAGLGLTPAQPDAAAIRGPPPFDVPIPEALWPLLRLFFP
jgi:hypothetical protein